MTTKSRIKVGKYPGVYFRESTTRKYHGKPDGCFDICFRDNHGKLVWEKIGWINEGYSEQMAVHIRGERLRAIRHGDELPKKKGREITLGEVWERYNSWIETNLTRPKDDRYRYKGHIKDKFSEKPLSKITPFELETLKADLTKKGLSPASVKHILALIRQIINKAISWELWNGENPVRRIKMPTLNNKRERFLTQAESIKVLDTLKESSKQVYEMALLSLHTGMRAGEIFALRWGHLDFENGIIHITDPKSGRAEKSYMTDSVKAMFKEKERGGSEEFVFTSHGNVQIKEISDTFERVVKKLKFNEGITDARRRVTFHTLRHTFASWLAMKGTPILVIKELLRHQSLAMTERYAHLAPNTKKQAITGIEEIFNAKEETGEISTKEK